MCLAPLQTIHLTDTSPRDLSIMTLLYTNHQCGNSKIPLLPPLSKMLFIYLGICCFLFFSFLASQTVEVTYEVDEDDSGGVACTYGVSGIALLFVLDLT